MRRRQHKRVRRMLKIRKVELWQIQLENEKDLGRIIGGRYGLDGEKKTVASL